MVSVAAILLNLPTFAAVIGVLTLLLIGAALLRIKPTRKCHLCGSRVLAEARRCKQCGYEFSSIRGVS